MGKSKAPKPPDPVRTAAAQTATNIGTALAEGALNRVNQVTPDGALTYVRSGTTPWRRSADTSLTSHMNTATVVSVGP